MALDDYLESEVGVAVVVTAAVLSPPVRRVLRRGAVYGLAGLMMAGDALTSFAQGVGRGMQQATASAAGAVQGAMTQGGEAAGAAESEAQTQPAKKPREQAAGAGRTRTQTPPAKETPGDE